MPVDLIASRQPSDTQTLAKPIESALPSEKNPPASRPKREPNALLTDKRCLPSSPSRY
jgi:hypothetical protein